jgi:two-component system alkaline phosphatase synthesis response regulator PhoP
MPAVAGRTIVVVEDERAIADALAARLRAEGFTVEIAGDGPAGVELCRRVRPDVVVLDVMLPGRDGFAVASELRQQKNFVPILMLTARGRPEDVLKGFAAGADDYLAKPAELAILLARIDGLLRRSAWTRNGARPEPRQDRFTFSGKTIDFDTLELAVGERVLQLTLMEANLLRYLIEHEGKAISRKTMLEQVWGLREDTDTRAIDNFIVRLRRYIEKEPARPRHLLTVRGVGYRFISSPE